jgi:hypothetical protein
VTPKALRELADKLFSGRGTLMTLWQEIAEQFYPERADFTLKREIGEDYAAHLITSFPLLCRRDLGNEIGVMLRPTNKDWKHMVPKDTRIKDNSSNRWLQWADETMRRAMYDPDAFFNKAMKEGDHDYAAFGQTIPSVQLNRFRTGLLYQTWHLKDCVWRENQDGKVDFFARNWNVGCRDLKLLFPKAELDAKITRRAEKNPFDEVKIQHIVCDADMWDGDARGRPRVSVFYDCDHNKVIEQVPIWGRIYLVQRWQTVSGSPYSFSPATVAALPEARLLQSMALTLLEAGEKGSNPPLVATVDAVKSDMRTYAGGVTWVSAEYDEKLGAALRSLNIDTKGIPINLELVKDSRDVLKLCFFLNKLRAFNPTTDPQMTAFQAGQIVQEYIRGALPLFEPMEAERNGSICEETFDILYRNGAFGSPQDIPDPIRNADIEFRFESPLHDAIDQQKGVKFLEFKQIVAEALTLDPAVAHIPDAKTILRDVAEGIRAPAKWMRTEAQVEQAEIDAAQQRQQEQLLNTLQQGSEITKNLGTARLDAAQADAAGA